MRLPIRSWKSTLSKLGLRLVEAKRRRPGRKARHSIIETLETRQMWAVDLVSQESNDEIGYAQFAAATVGSEFVIEGAIGSGSFTYDVDLYRVTLSAGQTLEADVDAYALDDYGQLSSLNSYLRLFDAYGNQLAANDDGYDPDTYAYSQDSLLSYTASSSGDYYLGISENTNPSYEPNDSSMITGYGGYGGAYKLQLNIIDGSSGSGSSSGSSGGYGGTDLIGDSIYDYQSVSLTVGGTTLETSAIETYDDVDMFRVYLTAGQTLTVDVDTPTGSLDSYLRLFDDYGSQLAYNEDDGSDYGDSSLQFTALYDGYYYVGLSSSGNDAYSPEGSYDGYGGTTGEYELRFTLEDYGGSSGSGSSGGYGGTDQVGNSIYNYQSVSLTVGVTTLQTSAIETYDDVDMFQVYLSAGQTLTVDIDTPTGNLDSYLQLFDDYGSQLAYNEDDGSDYGDSSLEYTAGYAGYYYVGVSSSGNNSYSAGGSYAGYGGTIGEYELRFTLADYGGSSGSGSSSGSSGGYGGTDQIGNTIFSPQSVLLTVGATQTVSSAIETLDDVDVFEVYLTAGQTLSLDVNSLGSGLNSYLRIFDEVGTTLASNDDEYGGYDGDSFLEFAVTYTGYYYVGISSSGNDSYDVTGGYSGYGGTVGSYELMFTLTENSGSSGSGSSSGSSGGYGGTDTIGDSIYDYHSVSLTVGVTTSQISAIETYDDVDMFRVYLTAGQTLTVDVDTPSGNLDSYLRLFDDYGSQIAYNEDDGSGYGDALLQYTPAYDGYYLVAISSSGNDSYSPYGSYAGYGGTAGEYELRFTLEDYGGSSGSGSSGGYGGTDLIGDTLFTGQNVLLTPGTTQLVTSAIETYDDVDIFQIYLLAGQVLTLDVDTPNSSLNSYLIVFDEIGMPWYSNDDEYGGIEGDSYLEFTAPYDAYYYVGISSSGNDSYDPVGSYTGYGGTTGEYELRFTLADYGGSSGSGSSSGSSGGYGGTDLIGDTVYDYQSVSLIVGGTTLQTSAIESNDDVDMFRVYLTAGQTLTVDVDTPTGNLDSYLRLFDEYGSQLAYNEDDGSDYGDSSLQYTASYGGYYYLGVSSSGNDSYIATSSYSGYGGTTSGDYELRFTLADGLGLAPEIVVEDEIGGDVVSGSTIVDLGSKYTGADWTYSFVIRNTGTSSLELDETTLSLPAGFELVQIFDSVVAPNVETSLIVRIPTTTVTTYSGAISFSTNDLDEVLFEIDVEAEVAALPNAAPEIDNPLPEIRVAMGTASSVLDLTPYFMDVNSLTGDYLTFSVVGNSNSSLVSTTIVGSELSLSYSAAEYGESTVTIRATDSEGLFVDADIVIRVLQLTNATPYSVGESYNAVHDTTLTINESRGVLINDLDVDGDLLTASLVGLPLHGTFTLNANGSFVYTPQPGYVGPDSFTYQASDGTTESATSFVQLNVVNQAPIASDVEFQTKAGVAFTIESPGVVDDPFGLGKISDFGLLNYAMDQNGDPLEAVLVAQPSNGFVTLDSNGAFVYVPSPGFVGSDSFTFQVSDGIDLSNVSTVSIQVGNEAPIGVADYFTISHDLAFDSVVSVLENDFDDDSDELTAELAAGPAHGTLLLASDGTFTYTPDVDYVGADSFTYVAKDQFGKSQAVTANLTVTNHLPIAATDVYFIRHDATLAVEAAAGVLANDLDSDLDGLVATLVSGPASGVLDFASDGSFEYLPAAGFVGDVSFSYSVSDGFGDSLESGVVTIHVVNSAPATSGETYSIHAGETLTADAAAGVLANELDADGDTLSVQLISDVTQGSLALLSDGGFTYVPNSSYVGTDLFTYKVGDGVIWSDPITVNLVVANQKPIATSASYALSHDEAVSVDATFLGDVAFDLDADDILTFSKVQGPSHGTLTLSSDGSFVYTPASNYVGTDSFKYRVFDGIQFSDEATVELTIKNSAPVAISDSYVVHHNDILTIDVAAGFLANDSDADGDTLTAYAYGVTSEQGTLSYANDGSFVFTPNPYFTGLVDVEYVVSDGIVSTTGSMSILVVDEAYQANPDEYALLSGTTLTVSAADGVLANDVNPDGDYFTFYSVTNVANGTLNWNSDGGFTYTPYGGFTGVDQFTYEIYDYSTSSPTPVTVTLHVYDEPLLAIDDAYQIAHDQLIVGDVSANDFNYDEVAVTAVLVSNVSHGVLTFTSDGTFEYVPDALYTGTDSFQYQLDDGTDLTNVATVTFKVGNHAPTASGQYFSILHDGTLDVLDPLLVSESEDADGDILVAAIVDQALHGTAVVNPDGSFSYTPAVGYIGLDRFTYQVSDSYTSSAAVTVFVNVTNAAPLAGDDRFFVSHDSTLGFTAADLLDNDHDADQDALMITITGQPSHGMLVDDGSGGFTYVPDAGFAGTDSITYKVNDGVEDSDEATITFQVVNSAPIAFVDKYTTDHDTALEIDSIGGLLANDFDADGDSLVVSIDQGPTHGTLTLGVDGAFSYVPDAGYVGNDAFTYQVSDGAADSLVVTVTLEVVNVTPVAQDDLFYVGRNETISISAPGILANDSGYEGEAYSVEIVSQAGHGVLTENGDGSFDYAPTAGYVGEDSFVYRIYDGVSYSEPATVSLVVENDVPVGGTDEFSIGHDATMTVGSLGVLANDYDLNGDLLTVQLFSGVEYGVLVLNADGTFTYSPNSGFVGADRFTYVVSDGVDQSEPVLVSLEVTNSAPRSAAKSYRIEHDKTLSVDSADGLFLAAIDDENDAMSFVSVVSPLYGTLTVNSDGSFAYVPNAGFTGTDAFAYRISDGVNESELIRVEIDVENTAPIAGDDRFTVGKGGSLVVGIEQGVLANDRDFDEDSLTVSVVDDVKDGTLTFYADGTFEYVPDVGFAGTDSFTYRVFDGVESVDRVVVIDVDGILDVVDPVPVAYGDSYKTNHDVELIVGYSNGVASNDRNQDRDDFVVEIVDATSHGSITLNADGSFQYLPNVGYTGLDTFSYRMVDENGNESDVATVSISVLNIAPIATLAEFSVHQGGVVTVSADQLLSHGFDIDGDELSVVVSGSASHGDFVASGGGFTYTPAAGFSGSETFSFQVFDGVSYSIAASIVVDVTNTRPFAADRTYQTHQGEEIEIADLLSTAGDADGDSLVLVLEPNVQPQNGTVSIVGGTIVYTPNDGFVGQDSFAYRVNDGAADSPRYRAFINVTNEAPEVLSEEAYVVHGGSVTIPLSSFDPDDSQGGLIYQVVSGGQLQGGTLTLADQVTEDGVSGFRGAITYQSSASQIGDATFKVRAWDGAVWSEEATITIHVTNVAPIASNMNFRGNPGESFSGNVAERSRDADGDALTFSIVDSSQANEHGQLNFNSTTGEFSFESDDDYVGSIAFTYKATDGLADSQVATITFVVGDSVPLAYSDTVTQQYSASGFYSFSLADLGLGFDPDGDSLTYLSDEGVTSEGGFVVSKDGYVTFQAGDPKFVGSTAIEFYVSDGKRNSNTATVTLNVRNSGPMANDDYFSARPNQTLSIYLSQLTSNDRDPDGDTLNVVSPPTSLASGEGTLTWNESKSQLEYLAPIDFVGTATFTYEITDGIHESETATVTIEVVNSTPWGIGRTYFLSTGEYVTFNPWGNDVAKYDIDGDSMQISVVNPLPAEFTQTQDGYQFNSTSPGEYVLTYFISDGISSSEPVNVTFIVAEPLTFAIDDEEDYFGTVNVSENGTATFNESESPEVVNLAPIAADDGVYRVLHDRDFYSNQTGQNLLVWGGPSLLSNDFDPDGDTLTATILSVSNGTATLLSNGHFHFTPDEGFVGEAKIEYEVSDGHGHTDKATATILVENHDPVSEVTNLDFTYSSIESTTVSFAPYASDPDADSLEYSDVHYSGTGSVTLDSEGYGGFIWASGIDPTGTNGPTSASGTLTYKIRDNGGGETTASIALNMATYFPPDENGYISAKADEFEWTGRTTTYNLFAGDYTSDSLTLVSVSTIPGLTWDANGNIEFNRTEPFFTPITGSYTIENSKGKQASASFTINPLILEGNESTYFLTSYGSITVQNDSSNYGNSFGGNGAGAFYAWLDGNGDIQLKAESGSSFSAIVDAYSSSPGTVVDYDVHWQGSADLLRIRTDGGISGGLSGAKNVDLVLGYQAYEDYTDEAAADFEGTLTAETVRISATGSIGTINASDRVIWVSAGKSITSVTASGDIGHVVGGGEGYQSGASYSIGSVTSSSGDIGIVAALSGSVGPVSAAGNIGAVEAASDVGAVTAGKGIGGSAVGSSYAYYGYGYDDYYYYGNGSRGVSAGRDVTGAITATNSILAVVAERDIKGAITSSSGSIYSVAAETGEITQSVKAQGSIGTVTAGTTIKSKIETTSGSIGSVTAGSDIEGNIAAGKDIGLVSAGGDLRGSVTATNGNILTISVDGEIDNSGITAGKSIRSISATEISASGGITAQAGFIESVTSEGGISGAITAKTFIETISAGTVFAGDIDGAIKAEGGGIGSVTAARGSINSGVEAAGDINSVFAYKSIGGEVKATGYLSSVTTETGHLFDGAIGAAGIGDVTAGQSILGAVKSDNGGIGTVIAGNDTYGDITGDIYANLGIKSIEAHGNVTVDDKAGVISSETESQFLNRLLDGITTDDEKISPPEKPDIPVGATLGGEISGSITSKASLGQIKADGDLSGDVEVAGQLGAVIALGDVSGSVTVSGGSAVVAAYGNVTKSISAHNHAIVSAYGDVTNEVTAEQGIAVINSAGSVTSSVSGKFGVAISAWDGVSGGTISSSDGVVSVRTYGGVTSSVNAARSLAVSAIEDVSGSLTSVDGSVFVITLADIRGSIDAAEAATLQTLGTIAASVKSKSAHLLAESITKSVTIEESVYLLVDKTVSADVTSSNGDVLILTGSVTGNVSISAPNGRVGIRASGNLVEAPAPQPGEELGDPTVTPGGVDASISARDDIAVFATSDFSGAAVSETGGIQAFALGNINATLTTNGVGSPILATAYGDISKDIDAGGSVIIFGLRDLSGDVSAEANVLAKVHGAVSGTIKAGGDIRLNARGAVSKDLRAGGDVAVVSGDKLTGGVISGGGVDIFALNGVDSSTIVGSDIVDIDTYGAVKSGSIVSISEGVSVAATDGVDATIRAAENVSVHSGTSVTSLKINSGGNVFVNALGRSADSEGKGGDPGNINGLELHAGGNVSLFATGDLELSSGTVDGVLSAFALGSVTGNGDLKIAAGAALLAGASLNAKVEVADGRIAAVGVNSLEGTYKATRGVDLATYGAASNLTIESALGSVSLLAAFGISETKVNAGQSTIITASDSVSGEFSAASLVDIWAGKDFSGTASGSRAVGIYAGGDVSGSATSQLGSVGVVAVGSSGSPSKISSEVNAHRDATVTSISGDVSGSVTAARGRASVYAGGDVSKAITAGTEADVWAFGDVSDSVSAKGSVSVLSYGDVSGDVTSSSGAVFVAAAGSLSGNVSAAFDATAIAGTGQVSGSVTAANGGAFVLGLDVTGDVSAGIGARVAALRTVSSTVTAIAGSAFVTAGDKITGNVSATLDVSAIAVDNIGASLSAGLSVSAITLGSQVGNVTAGQSAYVLAGRSVSGNVTAGSDLLVAAYSSVSGAIEAGGFAIVSGLGEISSGSIAAGDTVYVESGGDVRSNVSGGKGVYVTSQGSFLGAVDSGGDASVVSGNRQAGAVQAAGSVSVISFAGSTLSVQAGEFAYVWAFDSYQGNVYAGGDALVVSPKSVRGSVRADGSAAVYAIDYALGSVQAGKYASLVTFGSAFGPYSVSGDLGSYAFVGGDFGGVVESEEGAAALIAMGTVTGSVTAADDAYVFVVGDLVGTVSAGEYAQVVSYGQVDAAITAGADVIILSEGDVRATLESGRDFYVLAYGDVTGHYQAHRDAAIRTYGSFHGTLTADRDIGLDQSNHYGVSGLWAVGDIEGTIKAGRNIGQSDPFFGYDLGDSSNFDIFSYGDINATILALNGTQATEGNLGNIGAVGSIAGRIEAAGAIDSIQAGGAISATVVSPALQSLAENDAAFAALFAAPETPGSVRQSVLDDFAQQLSEVLADRVILAADIDSALAEGEADKQSLLDQLSATRAEVEREVRTAQIENAEAIAEAKERRNGEIRQSAENTAAEITSVWTLISKDRYEMARIVADAKSARRAKGDAEVRVREKLNAQLVAADQKDADILATIDEKVREIATSHSMAYHAAELALIRASGVLDLHYDWNEIALVTTLGLGQGVVNAINGLQDALFNQVNFMVISPFNKPLEDLSRVTGVEFWTLPYLVSPDWSRGLVVHEFGEPGAWDDMHGWSKFAGGQGLEILATTGLSSLLGKLRYLNKVDDVAEAASRARIGGAGRKLFTSLDDFKAGSGFVFKSEKEAAKAFEVYQNAGKAQKGIVIGHDLDPLNQGYNGWQAFRMKAADWSYEINMSWIDGAVDAGKPVLIATSYDKIKVGSITWQEMMRAISRGGKVVFVR